MQSMVWYSFRSEPHSAEALCRNPFLSRTSCLLWLRAQSDNRTTITMASMNNWFPVLLSLAAWLQNTVITPARATVCPLSWNLQIPTPKHAIQNKKDKNFNSQNAKEPTNSFSTSAPDAECLQGLREEAQHGRAERRASTGCEA